MKKRGIIFLLVLVIVYSVALSQIGNNKDGENKLVTTFNNSEFKTVQINLSSWGVLNQSFSSLEEMKSLSHSITKTLGISEKDNAEEKNSDTYRELVTTRVSKDAKTTVTLESIKYEEENSANTYVVIDIVLYGKYESTSYLKEKIDQIFKDYNITPTTNITITGNVDGQLSKEEKEVISKNMLKDVGGKLEETYETDRIYSVYGYTKLIDDWLISNGKKININLAFRYNEYEQKTYLYLATPVITVDY